MALKDDDLDEGTINKPKNTPFHNKLDKKSTEEKLKQLPNLRYETLYLPNYELAQSHPITKNNIIITGSNPGKILRKQKTLESPKLAKKSANNTSKNKISTSSRMLNISNNQHWINLLELTNGSTQLKGVLYAKKEQKRIPIKGYPSM